MKLKNLLFAGLMGPLFFLGQAHALESHETKMLSKSSSGKTVLMGIGSLSGIKAMDYAVVLKRINPIHEQKMRLVPVAKARVISVSSSESVWVLYKIFDPQLVTVTEKYEVFTESQMMNGRRRVETERLTIIDKPKNFKNDLAELPESTHPSLAQKAQGYGLIRHNHRAEKRLTKDVELVDLKEWKTIRPVSEEKTIAYQSAIFHSPKEMEFADAKRLETFELMVVNYLERVNHPNFNYEEFFYLNGNEAPDYIFRKKSNFNTEYQSIMAATEESKIKDARFYREVLEKGDSWSEDYSDEEMGTLLKKVGAVHEYERQKTILIDSFGAQLFLGAGLNFFDNENRKDDDNAAKGKYSVNIGGEFFPFRKFSTLQRLGLETSARYVKDGISVQNQYNAQSTEYSISGMLNWYPYYLPHTAERNAFFLGAGFRSGVVKLDIPTVFNQQANYNMISLPVVQMGVKYSFRSGHGLRLVSSVEKLLLDQQKNNNPTTNNLPNRTDYLDGRLTLFYTYFL